MRLHAAVAVACVATAAFSQNFPALPQATVDTTYPTMAGSTISVSAGGDFQAALNSAQLGDTIQLQAGATFTGNYILPVKSGTGWIIVRTSAPDSSLPPIGHRIDPTYSAVLPKIVTSNSNPAIRTVAGSNHFRLVGLEVTVDPAVTENYGAVVFGDSPQALSDVPSYLIVDRVFIHGQPAVNLRRGVTFNSAYSAVIDSYISEVHETTADSQAIGGWNGPGPFKIFDNYLEAAGENTMFGGADPSITNLVPSDIEIRKNHYFKPTSWMNSSWQLKNLFELKNAQRVLIDGNLFEYNWPAAQNGLSILFTVRNQDGTAPWSIVQDVTFTHNIVRHVAAAVNILGMDDLEPSQQTKRVLIANNVFEDVSSVNWGGNGRLFQIIGSAADVIIDHNTAFNDGEVVVGDGVNTGFFYTNNLTPNNAFGVAGDNFYGDPIGTLNTYFPGYTFRRNILQGGSALKYPLDNFFPATMTDVGFVDFAGGNYRLATTSPYKNAGTDGKDVGADIDSVEDGTASSLNVPSMFSATATTSSNVSIAWTLVTGATSYEVYRAARVGVYQLIATTAASPITDSGLASDTTYIYKVRALNNDGWSAFTPVDVATTTMFTDASLSGVFVKAAHFTQLRTAVNAMRAAAGLPAATFTDTSLSGITIKTTHLTELRTNLDAARAAIGLMPINYTDPVLAPRTTVIKAAHIYELRAGTQ